MLLVITFSYVAITETLMVQVLFLNCGTPDRTRTGLENSPPNTAHWKQQVSQVWIQL